MLTGRDIVTAGMARNLDAGALWEDDMIDVVGGPIGLLVQVQVLVLFGARRHEPQRRP